MLVCAASGMSPGLASCFRLLSRSLTSNINKAHYDVVVVGGGMVGFGFTAFAGKIVLYINARRLTPNVAK